MNQAKFVGGMQIEVQYLKKWKDMWEQSQLMLKQREKENVGLQVQINNQKLSFDQEVLSLKSIMKDMDRQMVKNKMSLTFFRDWIMKLQKRMHAKLNVLCQKNVYLQVDKSILLQRIEPLLALEKKELEQEGEEVQLMLVSESDVEVMKQSMLDIGNETWKKIKERLEA